MKQRARVKIFVLLAGILCLAFLVGSIVVQNLPEGFSQKSKEKKETAFDGISSYVMGAAYGSSGEYYKSENDFLYYLDASTGEKSIVCTKTNCEHEAGKSEGSLERTECEADFSHISAYIPHGNKLYYVPADPLGKNAPWEIWEQDLTGGGQKKIVEIDEKENTSITIFNIQCDGLYMVVSFEEAGYYNEKGEYIEYDSYRTKAGIYIINMNDWSFQRVYLTRDEKDNAFEKDARPYISQISLGSEDVSLYCLYYDENFDGKKINKLPEKKQINYLDKHLHFMQVDVSLSDGEMENAQSFDENHDFVYAGNWCMIQDYYGNFTAKQFRGGEGNSIVVYHSPENEEKEYDSGYRGVAVTERSVLYTIYDKKRDVLDWYRYDRETGQSECLAKSEASVVPQYATNEYVYVMIFWSDDDYEHYAIPLKELEKGKYQFPEKSEKKKIQEKQDIKNNNPEDTVVWGVQSNQLPSANAVSQINHYLKKSGYDFKVEFISALENDPDKLAQKYPQVDILQVPSSMVYNNRSADALKSGYYEPLSDFLDNGGKKLKKRFSETEWKQVEVNREIYSVPSSMLDYEGIYIAYNKKLKGKDGFKEADTLEKVEKIVSGTEVKAKYPIILLNSLEDGNLSGFADSDYCLGLALDHQTKKSELWYESKKVRAVYERFHTWYRRGWLSEENYISSTAGEDTAAWEQGTLQSGDWLVAIGYGACSEDIQKMSCEIVRPKQTVFSKANMSTGVASASNCKEQAEKFLELAYTDQKIADLMLYGVQKGNYQVKDGVVSNYSQELQTTFSFLRMNFGNQIAATPLDTDGESGKSENRRKYFQSYNVTESPLIGFQPDAGDYEKDLENYINAMRKGEDIWHAQNFDREYDSMVKKLAAKRMKQYRDDVEKQIKAWEG